MEVRERLDKAIREIVPSRVKVFRREQKKNLRELIEKEILEILAEYYDYEEISEYEIQHIHEVKGLLTYTIHFRAEDSSTLSGWETIVFTIKLDEQIPTRWSILVEEMNKGE